MWDDYLELITVVVDGVDIDERGEHDKSPMPYYTVGTEIPYWDSIVMLSDYWKPSSKEEASKGKYDAVQVLFETSGEFVFCYTKDRFKKKWAKFVEERLEANQEIEIEFIAEDGEPLNDVLKEEIIQKLKNGTKKSTQEND